MSFQGSGGVYVPRLTFVNKIILVVSGVFFVVQSLVQLIAGFRLEGILGLSFAQFLGGHLYQVLTYPFVQMDFFSFLFNGLVLWFVGSDLEILWGSRVYFKFFLVAIFTAAFSFFLVTWGFFSHSISSQLPMLGLHGFSAALLMAYGLLFQDRVLTFMLVFPMKAKYFCMLLVGMEFYMALFSPYRGSSWGHLGAFLGAILFLRGKMWWAGLRSGAFFSSRPRRRKGHLHLVSKKDRDEGEGGPGSSGSGPKFWH